MDSMVEVSGAPPKANWAVIVSSKQGEGAAGLVFDGNPETDWLSRHGLIALPPHWIGLAFGEIREIEGVSYLPRQGGFTNGVAKDYRVEVREAAGDWKTVWKGRSPKEVTDQRTALVVKFEEKIKVAGVRFVIEHQQTDFTLMSVRKGSAAALAGLNAGDVVVSVNGVPLPLNDLNPGWNWFESCHEAILGRASESVLAGKSGKLSLGVICWSSKHWRVGVE